MAEVAVDVKVEVGLDGFAIVPPAPLIIVHRPVPGAGLLPASVTDDVQLLFKSVPALAVTACTTVITTLELEAVHGGFEIVHVRV